MLAGAFPKYLAMSCYFFSSFVGGGWNKQCGMFLYGFLLFMKVEERSKLNRQSSPALQHKVANRISDPSLPPRSESFSSGGMQPARTPPIHRPVEPQVQQQLSFLFQSTHS